MVINIGVLFREGHYIQASEIMNSSKKYFVFLKSPSFPSFKRRYPKSAKRLETILNQWEMSHRQITHAIMVKAGIALVQIFVASLYCIFTCNPILICILCDRLCRMHKYFRKIKVIVFILLVDRFFQRTCIRRNEFVLCQSLRQIYTNSN
ncbi:unnamed protein product [Moneuplotes crassus]|uniref:Uncharacterized protein n=1 Tax=Euplotes crassus TaxID=5936 RepID=A0AAD1Y431_EUPCR|nr:unnamed protein product [Moneuplotes crassus]